MSKYGAELREDLDSDNSNNNNRNYDFYGGGNNNRMDQIMADEDLLQNDIGDMDEDIAMI